VVVQHEDVLVFTRPGQHAARPAPVDCSPCRSACASGTAATRGPRDSIRWRGCARGSRCGRH
jgi:hypothetical protein